MIPIILATHGDFARGIKDGAEMLVGKSEKVEYVSLQPGDDSAFSRKRYRTGPENWMRETAFWS